MEQHIFKLLLIKKGYFKCNICQFAKSL